MSEQSIDLLPFIGDTLEHWQIHRCQLNHAMISQHQPMKLIYHYEQLPDNIKKNHPLTGVLLQKFDQLMLVEDFANLLQIDPKQVAKPYQIKFTGKLVVFHSNPDIAIRLQWTNTLKSFEPVYEKDVNVAVEQAFTNWHFIDNVEMINKTPNLLFFVANEQGERWQLLNNSQFDNVPQSLAITLQQFLHDHAHVKNVWLAQMQAMVLDYHQQILENTP